MLDKVSRRLVLVYSTAGANFESVRIPVLAESDYDPCLFGWLSGTLESIFPGLRAKRQV